MPIPVWQRCVCSMRIILCRLIGLAKVFYSWGRCVGDRGSSVMGLADRNLLLDAAREVDRLVAEQ